MKITSLEIKQHEFEKSFRGYDIEEVNHFLNNLSLEWDRMLNELKMLKMQLEISEKEASKLKEVEMTLIKTLRTAEDTSTRITENATLEANKKIKSAEQRAEDILNEAEATAKALVDEAEQKAINIQSTAQSEFKEMESNFSSLELKKVELLSQLKGISRQIDSIVNGNPINLDSEVFVEKKIEQKKIELSHIEFEVDIDEHSHKDVFSEELSSDAQLHSEQEESSGLSFSSAVNDMDLEKAEDRSNLELIEGIGPKIKELLNKAHIVSFRDLANTPLYRLRDILDAGGPHYASHDPSSWIEQAELANKGEWEKFEELKDFLVAGRVPKETKQAEFKVEQVEHQNTEEMIDKVNKVKAAIRKAMVEKSETQVRTKSASDFVAEKKQTGSFFDNIN
jgi:cell division initiation protein